MQLYTYVNFNSVAHYSCIQKYADLCILSNSINYKALIYT